jgi:hypothetical protein
MISSRRRPANRRKHSDVMFRKLAIALAATTIALGAASTPTGALARGFGGGAHFGGGGVHFGGGGARFGGGVARFGGGGARLRGWRGLGAYAAMVRWRATMADAMAGDGIMADGASHMD